MPSQCLQSPIFILWAIIQKIQYLILKMMSRKNIYNSVKLLTHTKENLFYFIFIQNNIQNVIDLKITKILNNEK